MKRATAIFLFVVLTLPSAGYLFFFLIPRAQIRKEIRLKLESQEVGRELVLLKIPRSLENSPNASFRRFHEREFRYEGRMYDVYRQEHRGDTTWYYCLFDQKETELYNGLDGLVPIDEGPNPARRALAERLSLPLHWNYLPAAASLCRLVTQRPAGVSSFFFFSLKTWLFAPDPPPPRS